MEEKLFWISMTSGAYALALKRFMRVDRRVQDWRAVSLMNGLFWALTAVVIGVLLSSYFEWNEMSWGIGVLLVLGGFVWGFGLRALRSRDADLSVKILKDNLEWADTGFSAILLAAVIMYLLVQAFKIPSGSMRMTLMEGDHLFVNKSIYGVRVPYTAKKVFRWREVQRHDIVVFRFPTKDKHNQYYGKDFIKRCIGLPGDTIEIKDKKVFVNGKPTEEPFAHFEDDYSIPRPPALLINPTDFQETWQSGTLPQVAADGFRDNFGPITVPDHCYFVMGDNRDRSYDSRFWGPMPDYFLKGRAWVLYWPLSRRKIIR